MSKNLETLYDGVHGATRIEFRQHPAERYMRLRVLDGCSPSQLYQECVKHLRLPGFVLDATPRGLEERVSGWRVRGALRLVASGKPNKGGRPPAQTVPWLDERPDSLLSEREYMDRYGLTPYAEVDAEGKRSSARAAKFQNAVLLWACAGTRDFITAMTLADRDDRDVSKDIAKQFPRVLSKACRPVDVQAARELFFNLDPMSYTERIRYVQMVHMDPVMTSVAMSGAEAYLFHVGLSTLEVDDLRRWKTVRDVAFLRMDRMRAQPQNFDAGALRVCTEVLERSEKRIAEIEAGIKAKSAGAVEHLVVSEAEDFQDYPTILAETALAGERLLVQKIYDIGAIDAENRDYLLKTLSQGVPLQPSTKEALLRMRDQHFDKTQDGEPTAVGDLVPRAAGQARTFLDPAGGAGPSPRGIPASRGSREEGEEDESRLSLRSLLRRGA